MAGLHTSAKGLIPCIAMVGRSFDLVKLSEIDRLGISTMQTPLHTFEGEKMLIQKLDIHGRHVVEISAGVCISCRRSW